MLALPSWCPTSGPCKHHGSEPLRSPPSAAADGMGVEPKAVRIIDLKNRWASCSPGGNPELPLEMHDGPTDRPGLHRGP